MAPSLLGDMFQDNSVQNQRLRCNGKTLLVNARHIPAIGCVLVSHSDLGLILEPVRQSQLLWIITILALHRLASCFFANALVNKLLKRADTINAAIRQIQQGNFDIELPAQGSDFIDQIAENLNAMAARIKNLIQNNYEAAANQELTDSNALSADFSTFSLQHVRMSENECRLRG